MLGTIPNPDGSLPANQSISLDNLCKQYISFTRPAKPVNRTKLDRLRSYVQDRTSGNISSHESDDWSWTAEKVAEQCKFQRNEKSAAGPDNIPPVVLKHLSATFYEFLAVIFSFSWRHSVLPVEWVSANVFSLLKDPSKPLNDPSNYRPVSVTSIFIPTFEHLIHKKLIPLIDRISGSSGLIHYHQFGLVLRQGLGGA